LGIWGCRNKPYPLYKIKQLSNLKELITLASEKYGDQPAFTYERKKRQVSVSYRQFKSDVDALGTAIYDMGIANTKIAVIGENSYEWILAYFATVNSGNVIVPIDRELPPEDVKHIISDCDAAVFVYSETYADIAEHLKNADTSVQRFISMNTVPEMLETGNSLIHNGENNIADYTIDGNALAAILYTSGTTGMAKGVMLSHKSIAHDVVAGCQLCSFSGVSLFVLPLHHSFALTGGILIMLHSGCNIVINKSLKTVADDLKKYKPNNTLLVPLFVETFYKKVWDNAEKAGKAKLLKTLIKVSNALLKAGIDVRAKIFKTVQAALGGNIDLIITGGAPIDFKYIKGFRDFGIQILNGYGITECSPVVSVNRKHHYRDGSIGRVFPACEVKILDPDENGHGEICVKGDIVMLGYYNNEQATKEAFDGEWFKTGRHWVP
jgi:long-chain acyl-CoA synthetase